MPFGVVRGVDRGIGVLNGSGDRRREGAVLWMNLGRPIVLTNGAFAARSSQITLRTCSSTLCNHSVRFSAVNPEFTTLECVQQAAIITGVTLTTYVR